ncbi:MAG: hotdog fold thioesterase [Chloroflexota bacterium]
MTKNIDQQIDETLQSLSDSQKEVALSALKAIQNAKKAYKHPFNSLCNIKRKVAEKGKATATLQVAPHLNNSINILHGGAAFTLADAATGMAAFSVLDHASGEDCVTQDLHYRFLRPVVDGTVIAEGTVVRKGRNTIVVEAKMYVEDKLIGIADGTYFIIRPAPSGQS